LCNLSNIFDYFVEENFLVQKDFIELRKHRKTVRGLRNFFHFMVGDILEIVYFRKNVAFIFSGICKAKKKKNMLDPDTSFILRNTIMQIGIELKVSYYYNRVYKMTFLDFKRKQYTYRKKRMFTIRYTLSRNSKV